MTLGAINNIIFFGHFKIRTLDATFFFVALCRVKKLYNYLCSFLAVFMNVNGLKRLFEDDFWDHPIIYFLGTVAAFRALRGLFLLMLSSTWDYWGGIEMKKPIIFIRAVWLL